MGQRSVSHSIGPLRSGPPGPLTPVGPQITEKMVAETCPTLVQNRHPSSPPSLLEGTVPLANAAGAWIQEDEGEALREPPRYGGRRRRLQTQKRKSRHGDRSLSRDAQDGAKVRWPWLKDSPIKEGPRRGDALAAPGTTWAAGVTITSSANERERDAPARATPLRDQRMASAGQAASRADGLPRPWPFY